MVAVLLSPSMECILQDFKEVYPSCYTVVVLKCYLGIFNIGYRNFLLEGFLINISCQRQVKHAVKSDVFSKYCNSISVLTNGK